VSRRGAKPGQGKGITKGKGADYTGPNYLNHPAYKRNRRALLEANDVCVICGHGGADEADHIIPVARGGDRMSLDNLQPAHCVRGCPTCGRKCNRDKGVSPTSVAMSDRTSIDHYTKP